MKIGDLAEATGVSVQTIRLYEREGLIGSAQRTSGRFRLFGPQHEVRLRFIKQLRELGFVMDDIRSIIAAKSDRDDNAVLAALEGKAKTRAHALSKLIDHLTLIQAGEATFSTIEVVFEDDHCARPLKGTVSS